MRKQFIHVLLLALLYNFYGNAQRAIVKGRVVDSNSNEIVSKVKIGIQNSVFGSETDLEGRFMISDKELPEGEQIIVVSKLGYSTQWIRVIIRKGQTINLDPILLEFDLSEITDEIGLISISEDELENEEGASYTISGLLQSSKDVFYKAAAFDFGATFFRPRGLDNSNNEVFINGIKLNRLTTGRPQWDSWGGLNDVQRNREFSIGMKAIDYGFGAISGTTNIIMRASEYSQGGRLSIAASNRTYEGRIMASYNSGNTLSGWSYSVLLARRFGQEGFKDGTFYDANSFFLSAEKKITNNHSFNITGFYTPVKKGRATAITKEVKELKGPQYNPFWGYQNGILRNSKVREIKEPFFMLNHFWNIGDKTKLNTTIGYQFGTIGNTRIDTGGTRLISLNGAEAFIGGARNPFANYYQRLPSYFLRFENPSSYDYHLAYLAEKEFIKNGQLDWNLLYLANKISLAEGGNSIYVLQEDRSDDTQLYLNSILKTRLTEHCILNGKVSFRNLKSENYALIKDLLGGNGYLDVDYFAEGETSEIITEVAQSDLQNKNRIVVKGDRYKYNYNVLAKVFSGFAQVQFNYPKADFYLGTLAEQTSYERIGLFENGNYPEDRSYGSSEKISFTNFSVKGGVIYKFDGRHLVEMNLAYVTKAPNLRNTFSNPRQNNDIVQGLESENLQNADASYIFRSPRAKVRITGYYNTLYNQTNINFYFTESVRGKDNGTAFLQEVLTKINSRRIGGELGIEYNLTPSLKLKGAASVGENVYTNNPRQYFTSEDFIGVEGVSGISNEVLVLGRGNSWIKNYHVAGGPERAYQLGFEYSSPSYWWGGLTYNYFSNAYIGISTLRRSDGFGTDHAGNPFNNYRKDIAKNLLRQEKFPHYYLVNVVGGKSWKIKRYYVGFFATMNNILGQEYITAGFENSRYADYRKLKEEDNRESPVFGSRYLFGNGATYYVNLFVRF